MSDSQNSGDQRIRLQRALEALRDMRAQLETAQRDRSQPIAIVGMGCRFPGGVKNPDDYWRLLSQGGDAIGEVPADRWDIDAWFDPDPETLGKMTTRCGGFLDCVDEFDAQFFGIAPREADYLDPQQRLLLEVAWEALEQGAIAPDQLRGSATGVFVGISSGEYGQMLASEGAESIGHHYAGSGNANSVAAGRISYVLDLKGPALAIDTACSSSLIAVQQACQSLRSGQCEMALAGGVNLMLTPLVSVNHSQARMLAPDGRCKTFAASADGFVRSDGCGVVVLKLLDEALAAGDNIQAVIRGMANNQDGHTSALTVPSGPSQQDVIVRALQDAGLSAQQIGYVEAHGTGTSLGDPIELNALGGVFASTREAGSPLMVGSVKTNIGHAEAAAGIAGLIKVVLSLQHRTIPRHLHFDQPTQKFDWASSPLAVPRESIVWDPIDGARVAGVSSFGFGGTNAHLVVEEAPSESRAEAQGSSPSRTADRLQLLPVSGQSEEARRQLCEVYAEHLQKYPEPGLPDVCLTAGSGRSHFRHRAALLADSTSQATERLRDVAESGDSSGVFQNVASVDAPKIAFLFTGQGAQHVGMGRELFDTEPVFRKSMEKCQELLGSHFDPPLLDVIYPRDNKSTPLNETSYTQPALFAVEFSLAELWKSWGIVPDVVLGHSVGEYVAACLAGVMSLQDALHLISVRGRLMQELPGGAMAAVMADHDQVAAAIRRHAAEVSIAAINGPRNTVVSGSDQHVDELLRLLRGEGVESQPLVVSHAFHSAMVEPIMEMFVETAGKISFADPQLDLVSNLTGQLVGAGEINADYWSRHMRQAVRFADGIETVHQQDCRLLVEIGPKPVLSGMGRQCVTDDQVRWLPSLRPGRPDRQQMLESLAELYTAGADVRWSGVVLGGRRIEMPTYPFQRRRHWADELSSRSQPERGRQPAAVVDAASGSLLLGSRIDCANHPDEVVFQARLGSGETSFLDQHRVFGNPILPAAGYLSMARSAAECVFECGDVEIRNVNFHAALKLSEDGESTVQLVIKRSDGDWKVFRCSAGDSNGNPTQWTLCASGTAVVHSNEAKANVGERSPVVDLESLRKQIDSPLACEDFYRGYADRGVEFGPAFRVVRQLWFNDMQALGKLELSEPDTAFGQEELHPALLDAAAQVIGAVAMSGGQGDDGKPDGSVWIQSGIERFRSYQAVTGKLWALASIRKSNHERTRVADVQMMNESGSVVAEMLGVQSRPTSAATLLEACSASQAEPYEVRWFSRPRVESSSLEQELQQAWTDFPGRMAASIGARWTDVLSAPDIVDYAEMLDEVDSLSPLYVAHALNKLGWSPQRNQRFDADQLARTLGFPSKYDRLFHRLLEILADEGILSLNGRQWEVVSEFPAVDLRARVSAVGQRWSSSAELELLDRCGMELADVMCGKCDPLELIFPNGDMTTAARVYGDTPGVKAIYEALASAIVQAVESLPADRLLRILEIGAGTGGTSAFALPCFPADRTEYVFTDISQHFLPAAKRKFEAFPFVRYEVLDIERLPSEQGFDGHSFDMIISSNVLHATCNLHDTMRHVCQLLSPGGLLLLSENVEPSGWVELIWGLTDGWWRFDDDLRTSHPLLTGSGWKRLLQASGFGNVEPIAAAADQYGPLSRQAIVVAQYDGHETNSLQAESAKPNLSDEASPWLILGDADRVAGSVAAALRAQGTRCVMVQRGQHFARRGQDEFEVDPNRRADFDRLLDDVCGEGNHLGGVLYLWGEAYESIVDRTAAEVGALVHENFMAMVHLIQALGSRSFESSPALWLVTRGAQPASEVSTKLRPELSPLSSIGKVVALEYPDLWGGMLDLDPQAAADEASAIVSELLYSDGEDQIALRGGERLVPRLMHSDSASAVAPSVRHDASYLITGGCGAIGLAAAAWLVSQGARQLVLLGRSGAETVSARQAVADLVEAGANVHIVCVDVSDEVEMSRLLEKFNHTWPRLSGVIHAAGRPGHLSLAEMDETRVRDVLAAKVAGTWGLHQLTKDLDLDFFITCSSMVSVWGAKEQSHYCAANQFLDVMAHYRRGLGLPALSVNWGPLTGGGMLPDEDVAELKRIGVSSTPIDRAIPALGQLLGSNSIQTTLVDIDWPTFKSVYESRGRRPLFEQLGGSDGNCTAASDVDIDVVNPIVEQLRAATPGERRELLCEHLQAELSSVLGLFDLPDPQVGFFDMGMDSLTAVDLRARLEKNLGSPLPATLAFDYPTIESLAEFLGREQFACDSTGEEQAGVDAGLATDRAASEISDIENLSDEEIEAALLEKLQQLDNSGV